jgi:inosine-uridine nucleoside N-ribohydrolase
MQKVIIDTDPGQDIDDLLALLFALRRPELEILGITTVTWPATGRARLVKRLLRYLGREDIPVRAGSQLPMRPFTDADFAKQFNLGHSLNHRCFYEPLDPRDEPTGEDAVDFIISTLEAHPGEVAILGIAPFTNLGRVFQRRPDLAARVKFIALMGGDLSDRRENNVAMDCPASEILLGSGAPIYLGTWSVTRQFTLTMEDCAATFGTSADPLHRALWTAIQQWHPAQNWKPGPVMYDLFPMLHAYRQDLYTLEPHPLRVEDGRTVITPGAPEIHLTTAIDAQAVRQVYLETVFG